MVTSRLLLALCLALAAESKSGVISEECEDPLLKRMWQCANEPKDRNEIVDLISFRCFEIGKRGPCSEGELFFLNRDSDCFAPHCIKNGGCEEGDIFYEGECWNSTSRRTPCQSNGWTNHILITDSFGENTCQPDLSTRGVFDLPPDADIPSDVIMSKTVTQETRTGDIKTLQEKLCSLHCGRNLPSFKLCSCQDRTPRELKPESVSS